MPKKLAKRFNCPTEFALDVLGGKWKTVLLCYLKERPCRYRELRLLVPRLSDKVLTERLRELTEKGLVMKRKEDGHASVVTYSLTPKGQTLGKLLSELYAWGEQHAAAFGVEVGEPLKRLGMRR
ncbi:MAG TPA: helix-turn-helix domain-containing protein [Steroidobacteraceae bacterium]|nr:helix-turn-helix domain-containing protein [Steroidobacteraceae bacterium]